MQVRIPPPVSFLHTTFTANKLFLLCTIHGPVDISHTDTILNHCTPRPLLHSQENQRLQTHVRFPPPFPYGPLLQLINYFFIYLLCTIHEPVDILDHKHDPKPPPQMPPPSHSRKEATAREGENPPPFFFYITLLAKKLTFSMNWCMPSWDS